MSISDLSLWPPTQRNARRRLTFAFFLSLLLACTLAPKLSAQMKLLSPDTGWFANHGHLFWTSDNGAHWKDITPSGSAIPKGAQFGGVFFLNAAEGWATLSYPEPLAAPTPQARANQKALYMIAHTENSGETWDVRPLTYPPLPASEQDAITGPASLYFLDSMHGWLDVVAYQSMFNPGKLLATEDGGQTWNWVGSPIHCGPIYFHSLKDGWLISDAGARELYVTHDGAKSWQETRLQAPSELGAAVYPTFMEMPMFKDSQNGYLAVHYSAPGFSSLKLVVYATQSGGKSWQSVKVLPGPAYPLVALTDSVVILPTISGKGKPTTEVVPLTSQAQPTRPVSSQRQNAITAFSFLNGSDGWAIKDGLYATDDGGATWKNISPPSNIPPFTHITIPAGKTFKVQPSSESGSSTVVPSGALLAVPSGGTKNAAHLSRHLGFDRSYVASVSEMATWWQSSPYYDTGIYLPGSHNRGVDSNLTPQWVAQVQSQGWGITPIWFGLQAPCANATFSYEFTTTNAASMGQSEADSAAAAASALGLQNSVIYKDLENYTADSACSAAVAAYVGAWVNELHALGYLAGVYATPTSAEQDISTTSPLPDDIWVAKWDNKATIWSLGALGDTPWPSTCRMGFTQSRPRSSRPPQGLRHPFGKTA